MRARRPRLLMLLGLCLFVYGGVTLASGDLVTGSYTRLEQRRLASQLASRPPLRSVRPELPRSPRKPRPSRPRVPRLKPSPGKALGWIVIPKIGVKAVFVEGTSRADLRKGPGHYEMTPLPGAGGTVAIAGHRTTYGAFFRHIDDLRTGDKITLRLGYGEFRYVVFAHRIVDRRDWSIIRPRRFETLVLSACHPLYSAAQRWVVFARLAREGRRAAPAKRQPRVRRAAAVSSS
jgi:sortase A